ncbi:MAG: hypothetical protein ACTSRZ_12885 [Promethearchaeota archaeon]
MSFENSENLKKPAKDSEKSKKLKPSIEKIAGPDDIQKNIVNKEEKSALPKAIKTEVEQTTINFILDEIEDQVDLESKIKQEVANQLQLSGVIQQENIKEDIKENIKEPLLSMAAAGVDFNQDYQKNKLENLEINSNNNVKKKEIVKSIVATNKSTLKQPKKSITASKLRISITNETSSRNENQISKKSDLNEKDIIKETIPADSVAIDKAPLKSDGSKEAAKRIEKASLTKQKDLAEIEKIKKIKEIKTFEPKQLDKIKQNLQKIDEESEIKGIDIKIRDDGIFIKVKDEKKPKPASTLNTPAELENKPMDNIQSDIFDDVVFTEEEVKTEKSAEIDFKNMFSEIMKRKQRIRQLTEHSKSGIIDINSKATPDSIADNTASLSSEISSASTSALPIEKERKIIIKLPKPVKISLPKKEISPDCISIANKYLNKLDKNLRSFFQTLPSIFSKKFKQYIKRIEIAPDTSQSVAIAAPNKKNNYEVVITQFNAPIYAEISFIDLNIEKLIIEVLMPEILLGENYEIPEIILRTNIKSTWENNAGLVWYPITKSFKKYGFFPFSDLINMIDDLRYNFNAQLIDPFCDYLNNYKTPLTKQIWRYLQNYFRNENYRQNWMLKNLYKEYHYNEIFVPIFYEYIGSKQGTIVFSFLAHSKQQYWPSIEKVISEFFNPMSRIVSYFSGIGPIEERIEVDYLLRRANENE